MGVTQTSADAVQQQLQRILSSPAFSRSRRLSQFLRFTVELTVQGRSSEIKEHRIGAEVFERGPDFDPQADTIVRTQAHRLRSALSAYYENEGRTDPLVIEFAKGSYVPAVRENSPAPATPELQTPPRTQLRVRRAVFAVLVLAGGVASGWFAARRLSSGEPEFPLSYVSLPLFAQGMLSAGEGQAVISPSGSSVVFPLIENSGARRLWLRPLRSMNSIGLAGTEGGSHPFWSPDESEIGFFANGMLKVFRTRDGNVRNLCEAPLGRGGSWNREGVIIFTPHAAAGRIHRISPGGGKPVPLTALDTERDESSHRWPEFLGDGRHFVYAAQSRKGGNDGIYLTTLDGLEPVRLDPILSQARYAHTREGDYLLFVKEKSVRARRLNLGARRMEGPEVTLVKNVYYSPWAGASFSIAGEKYLLYQSTRNLEADPVVLDRAGRVIRTLGARGNYEALMLCREGRHLAAEIAPDEQSDTDIWTGSGERGPSLRVTLDGGAQAVWSPDCRSLVFVAPEDGFTSLRRRWLGEGEPQIVVHRGAHAMFPNDISPDGRYLAYHVNDPVHQMDLMLLPLDPASGRASGAPIPVRRSRFNEGQGFFSPDGRYLAYFSDESGQQEVYVEALPPEQAGQERRWKVSTGGGVHPRWRRDGRELFFLSHGRSLMSVAVSGGAGAFGFGTPRNLFTLEGHSARGRRSPMAVAPDGNSFYFLVSPAGSGLNQVSLLTGWISLLNQRSQ
jgi:Tol biopolymer transport system component